MAASVDRKRFDCSALPKGWQREEITRKSGLSIGKVDVTYYSGSVNNTGGSGLTVRSIRADASLVPPIRQTASIFKQPVTVYKTQESKVKSDFKHGPQEKPRQLLWEKRLEGLRACNIEGEAVEPVELPGAVRAAGPCAAAETCLRSLATALHVSPAPIVGQPTGNPDRNPAIFLNPDQPLIQSVSITDEDIRRQEERVNQARKKLQETLAHGN